MLQHAPLLCHWLLPLPLPAGRPPDAAVGNTQVTWMLCLLLLLNRCCVYVLVVKGLNLLDYKINVFVLDQQMSVVKLPDDESPVGRTHR
jgi:hypothetical protein